jgi:hypothetical protein
MRDTSSFLLQTVETIRALAQAGAKGPWTARAAPETHDRLRAEGQALRREVSGSDGAPFTLVSTYGPVEFLQDVTVPAAQLRISGAP